MHLDMTPAQEAFRTEVEAFARERVKPKAAEIDESNAFPVSLVWEAASRGLLGITIPREHGGLGHDHVGYALAIEAVARASATLAVILTVSNSLVAEVLLRFGSDAQRARWLHPLATGELVGVFALSEENAGTDAANQETAATPEGDGWRLAGRKVWVANAEAAAIGIVFAATQPGLRGRGISAFLLPLDREGIRREPGPDSLGVRGLGCMDLVLDGVRVDRADVIGRRGRRVRRGARRARGRARGHCGAVARALDRRRSTRRSRTRRRARRSGGRLPTTRRFSGSSRTWPRSSKPRAC